MFKVPCCGDLIRKLFFVVPILLGDPESQLLFVVILALSLQHAEYISWIEPVRFLLGCRYLSNS